MSLTLSQQELQELQNLVDDIPVKHGLPIVMFFLRINEERKQKEAPVEGQVDSKIKELHKKD